MFLLRLTIKARVIIIALIINTICKVEKFVFGSYLERQMTHRGG